MAMLSLLLLNNNNIAPRIVERLIVKANLVADGEYLFPRDAKIPVNTNNAFY